MKISCDIQIILVGFFGFCSFLITHFILFRFLKPEQLFKGILLIFIIGVLDSVTIAFFVFNQGLMLDRLVSGALSLTVYCLLAFIYILCIFGPYETSIRMRLIRELSKESRAFSLDEILNKYNLNIILNTRLKRLLGSGDLKKDGQVLKICKTHNAFFAIDAIARQMHVFIHARPKA